MGVWLQLSNLLTFHLLRPNHFDPMDMENKRYSVLDVFVGIWGTNRNYWSYHIGMGNQSDPA